ECVVPPLGNRYLPAEPLGLARQVDRLHLLHLDAAVLDEIVERSVGRACDLHAVEINFERAAMIRFGEGRGIADAFAARGHPILLLVKTLLDVLAGGAAVL